MIKNISLTFEDIAVGHMKNKSTLDHATLFTSLKDLLDDRIQLTIEAQFIALQNMFTQGLEGILNQRMHVLANIQAESMHRVVDQLIQHNVRLQSQVANLTRKVRSTVAARVIAIWIPLTIRTLPTLLLDPRVTGAAVEQQTPRQQEQEITKQSLRTKKQIIPQVLRINSTLTPAQPLVKATPLLVQPTQSMTAVAAGGM